MEYKQTTDHVLMVRPVAFGFNAETAENNYYQNAPQSDSDDEIQRKALAEFDSFVSKLRANDIKVTVVEDSKTTDTPDSIFPNNWVSFHADGHIVIYPMFAENRRLEKRREVIDELIHTNNFNSTGETDFSYFESEGRFLEGTGSLILDRPNRMVYASVSERMDQQALKAFCEKMNYRPVVFHAMQDFEGQRKPIYHTNVMMCLGNSFAVICLECIDDIRERETVVAKIEGSGKEVIPISEKQVNSFAGNMLEVYNRNSERLLVMSTAAYESLNDAQLSKLSEHCRIIHSDLSTIENHGGGSARCMMAEVYLPKLPE
ncbi:MAG: arginine deiminase-related protein [Cyclobacteriaceae bacterium]